MSVILW